MRVSVRLVVVPMLQVGVPGVRPLADFPLVEAELDAPSPEAAQQAFGGLATAAREGIRHFSAIANALCPFCQAPITPGNPGGPTMVVEGRIVHVSCSERARADDAKLQGAMQSAAQMTERHFCAEHWGWFAATGPDDPKVPAARRFMHAFAAAFLMEPRFMAKVGVASPDEGIAPEKLQAAIEACVPVCCFLGRRRMEMLWLDAQQEPAPPGAPPKTNGAAAS